MGRPMKRILAGVVFGVLVSSAAVAADLRPVYKAPAPMERIYDWTGFYVGAHVGYISGHTSNDTAILPNGGTSNWFAGVQGGYRHQFSNNMVLGAQISAPIWSGDEQVSVFGNQNHVDPKYAVLGQIQLGYAVGRFLPYLTAGIGGAKVEAFEVLTSGVRSATVSNTHTIYTLGFGVNYALTQNVALGLVYNHTESSRERYDCGPAVCGIVGAFDFTGDTVAATLEYKF
jgi:opacity protein-like surface antigen